MKKIKFIPRYSPEKTGGRTSKDYYKKKKQPKKEGYFLLDIGGRKLDTAGTLASAKAKSKKFIREGVEKVHILKKMGSMKRKN